MNGERGVTQSIIDELHSWDIQGDQMEGESGALEVSLMNFILRTSKEVKWKVKLELLEVSLKNLILRIKKDLKFKLKVVLLKVSLMKITLGISKENKRKVRVM